MALRCECTQQTFCRWKHSETPTYLLNWLRDVWPKCSLCVFARPGKESVHFHSFGRTSKHVAVKANFTLQCCNWITAFLSTPLLLDPFIERIRICRVRTVLHIVVVESVESRGHPCTLRTTTTPCPAHGLFISMWSHSFWIRQTSKHRGYKLWFKIVLNWQNLALIYEVINVCNSNKKFKAEFKQTQLCYRQFSCKEKIKILCMKIKIQNGLTCKAIPSLTNLYLRTK